ncbi:MAG: hypothetical protein L0229_17105 [Blastocatellia bacterium]|nr:hypothetical protein [Blastocatellia bacterium]
MRRIKIYGFASLAILLLFNFPAGAQSKAKRAGTKFNGKQVTVTLVRWPYT